MSSSQNVAARIDVGFRWIGVAACSALLTSACLCSQAQASETAPVIRGTPTLSVLATQAYAFQPTATDAEHNRLTFSIRNKPAWATFDARTGRLRGTPARSDAGNYANIVVGVSDGKLSAMLHPFTLRVVALINRAPRLSGSAPSRVTAGQRYLFQPSASDADGNRLNFSVQNKPAWLELDSKTGRLTGVPTASTVGTFSNIVLSVSDGRATTRLQPFAITVVAPATRPPPPARSGSVTLDWIPPSENTDSSVLTDLTGYRVYYGTAPSSLNHRVELGAGLTRYVVDNLAAGTWYFGITTLNRQGSESNRSPLISVAMR